MNEQAQTCGAVLRLDPQLDPHRSELWQVTCIEPRGHRHVSATPHRAEVRGFTMDAHAEMASVTWEHS